MSKDTSKSLPDEFLLDAATKEAAQKTWDLDSVLGFGNYQHFQIWVVQTLVAIIGALNYYHLVFMVSDPPEWGCVDSSVDACTEGAEEKNICGGGEVVFNTSHQNFIHSLPVEHNWLCDEVCRCLVWLGIGLLLLPYSSD